MASISSRAFSIRTSYTTASNLVRYSFRPMASSIHKLLLVNRSCIDSPFLEKTA